MTQKYTPKVRSSDLPACRDKYGHLTQYPGQIVFIHDDWRLVYVGTLDGRHEFFAERAQRINLGPLSLEDAKVAMLKLVA